MIHMQVGDDHIPDILRGDAQLGQAIEKQLLLRDIIGGLLGDKGGPVALPIRVAAGVEEDPAVLVLDEIGLDGDVDPLGFRVAVGGGGRVGSGDKKRFVQGLPAVVQNVKFQRDPSCASLSAILIIKTLFVI